MNLCFFDSNPLKYIIGQARIIDSSDLQDYHNIYQEEFESRNLKPYNRLGAKPLILTI